MLEAGLHLTVQYRRVTLKPSNIFSLLGHHLLLPVRALTLQSTSSLKVHIQLVVYRAGSAVVYAT